MRKCLHCLKDYPDHMSFCPECGKALSEIVMIKEKFCPNCGIKNKPEVLFCENCGFSLEKREGTDGNRKEPVSQNGTVSSEMGMNQDAAAFSQVMMTSDNGDGKKTQKASKIPMVVGLSVLVVIAGIAAFVGVFVVKRPSSENTAVVNEVTSEREESASAEKNELADTMPTPSPTPEPTVEPTPEVTQEPVDEFRKYYEELDIRFGRYIITTADAAKIDTYSNMLQDALTQKDAAMCRTVKKNLDKLERRLEKSSKKKLAAIKKDVQSWEKKASSKKVKKSTVYKKIKQNAKKFERTGNYADARSKYLECIGQLKAAKEKDKDKKEKRSANFYKPLRKDNDTYKLLIHYNLSREDVAKLSSEEIRYYVNTIFAVVGYQFSNPDIRDFFKHQSWYDGGFTGNQQKIIELLDASDGYKGTPLSNNFHLLHNGG